MTRCMNYDPNQRPFFRAIMRDINKLEEQSKPGAAGGAGGASAATLGVHSLVFSLRSRHCLGKEASHRGRPHAF